MRHWKYITIAGFLSVVLAITIVYAQPPSGGPEAGVPGRGGPGMGGGMGRPGGRMGSRNIQEMMKQREAHFKEMTGLTDKEVVLLRQTMNAKMQARQRLTEQMGVLEKVAFKKNATDAELRNAAAAYRKSVSAYRSKIASLDAALAEKLTLRSRTRLLALGALDNALGNGMGLMGSMMGGRGSMMGGGMMGGRSGRAGMMGGSGSMRGPGEGR
jgi:hypothetical protein